MKKKFPEYRQLDSFDCGPTCLRIIAKHYGKTIPVDLLRKRSYINRDGVAVSNLAHAAETVGFRSLAVTVDMQTLEGEVPLPCVALWRKKHYVVFGCPQWYFRSFCLQSGSDSTEITPSA